MSDRAQTPESALQCQRRLGISHQAAALYHESEVIDLHIDSFIWTRVFGYDITVRHDAGLLGARYFRQVDLPRLRQVGVEAATWVITTNPLRTASSRRRTLARNIARLESILNDSGQAKVVSTYDQYQQAKAAGLHSAFLGVQGGNALGPPYAIDDYTAARLLRVTLLHLTSSPIGATSSPLGWGQSLGADGGSIVEALNHHKILVDLAHIGRRAFDQALDVHSRSLPPIVTHTGVCGAYPHWRNLDDVQLRSIANRGGVVGIMYYAQLFLSSGYGRGTARDVARHIAHAVNVCGSDGVCLGSDWDGLIVTPRDMPTCLELPRLVQALLDIGMQPDIISKVLGKNFLRVLREVRP